MKRKYKFEVKGRKKDICRFSLMLGQFLNEQENEGIKSDTVEVLKW